MQAEHRLGWVRHTTDRCVFVCLLAAVILGYEWKLVAPSVAQAQSRGGLGTDALPGLVSVPSAGESSLVAGALTAGYGYRGEVLGLSDSHHRIDYEGAVSGAPLPYLLIAGSVDGRIDTHKGDSSGGTAGFATQGSFTVRGRFEARESLHLGLEFVGLLPPSKDLPHSPRAFSPEFNGMATYETDTWLVTGAVGTRINRGDYAFPSNTTLSPYEALALGLSNDTQILLGAGAAVAAGPLWCVFDFQYEPSVGASGTPAKWAPALLGLGVRGDVKPWLQLGMNVQLSLMPYPGPAQIGTVPVPPRVSAQGFVALRWDKPEPQPGPSPLESEPAPAAPVAPATTTLSGEVTGLHGRAVPDAPVNVLLQKGDEVQTRTLPGGTTRFEFADVEQGDWDLVVEAKGYEPARRTVRLPVTRPLQIRLDRALPPGHIEVRVQDFRGRQVDARVVVLPDRTPFQPTSETGLFGLDLAPGEYEIEIVAQGYAPETRTAVVAQNGVTIVVVDLRRAQESE